MLGFALLIIGAGMLLTLRPDLWWRVNEPRENQRHGPTDAALRAIRRRGISLSIAGLLLAAVQLFLK